MATAAAVLTPTAAQAKSYSHVDGTGDIFSAPYGSTALTPAPDRTTGDVIGSTIRHKRRAVVMQLRYQDIEPTSEYNAHVFVVRTPSMRRIVTLVGTAAFPGGRVVMTKPHHKKVACRIPHRIDYTANTATVVVPRSCLGKPRWVKVGMAGMSFTGFTGSDTMWFDDALSAGTTGVYSPRVYRCARSPPGVGTVTGNRAQGPYPDKGCLCIVSAEVRRCGGPPRPQRTGKRMMHRISALALIVAGAGLAVVGTGAPAGAAVSTSTITSPATGSHYLITDANKAAPPTVTVTGTSNGNATDTVDIRCYERPSSYDTVVNSVPVAADGSFSATMSTDRPYGTCTLRAVPSGLPSGSPLSTYAGPQVTTEWNTSDKVVGGPNDGKVYDYYVLFQESKAMNDFVSATGGGLWDSRLQYADGTASKYLWYENAALEGNEEGTRSFLQVDGHHAYGPNSAKDAFSGADQLAGMPALSYSIARTAASATIHESQPIVLCSSDTFPPTAGSCTQFNSAGVTLDRTITTMDGGRQVFVSDRWISTDGRAHVISPHYDQWVQAQNDAGNPTTVGLQLPWISSAFQTYSSDVTLPGTANVPVSMFVRDDNTAPNGDTTSPRGSVTFEYAPSAVFWTSNREFVVRDENVMVPAGGSRIVRQAFAMATTDADVAAMAASQRIRINQYRPDGLIRIRGGAFIGDDIYNTNGTDQTVITRKKRGKTAVFAIKVQNDGTVTDTFKVKGTDGRRGFTVHYKVGGRDVTAKIKHGTYRIKNLAPGQSRVIRLVVKVNRGAHLRTVKSWLVRSKSTHFTSSKDTVKAKVRVVRR